MFVNTLYDVDIEIRVIINLIICAERSHSFQEKKTSARFNLSDLMHLVCGLSIMVVTWYVFIFYPLIYTAVFYEIGQDYRQKILLYQNEFCMHTKIRADLFQCPKSLEIEHCHVM